MGKNLLDELIVELVYIQMKIHEHSYKDIASTINVNESYVRQINSRVSNKRYKLIDLYKLSNFWNIDITDLIPSKTNITKLKQFSDLKDIEINEVLYEIGKNRKI